MLARILEPGGLVASTDGAEILKAIRAGTPVWVELERKTDEADRLLAELGVHPLTIEDVWGPTLQPKIDDLDAYLYVVIHGIGSAHRARLETAEVDLLIGPTWVITHDRDGLVADDLGTELDRSPRLLAKGAAWLAHAVLDRCVDRYMPVVDALDRELEALELDVLERAGKPAGRGVLGRILAFKRELQTLRRMSIHQRELLLRLARGEYDEIPADALPFYRDVYDHFLRVQDVTEGYRDLVTSCLDAYLSVQSNRMNEVMKTLTLMSTVMLPLTFIAGVYGMNFDNMPEIHWFWGYPFALILMASVAVGIFVWFRARGWIGGGDPLDTDAPAHRHPSRSNMPAEYSTISPATADAATVSGEARNSRPGPERPL